MEWEKTDFSANGTRTHVRPCAKLLSSTPGACSMKGQMEKLDSVKIKNSCSFKDTVNK